MEFLGHWSASGLVMKHPANKHHKTPALRSIISQQLTLRNHRKRPHWNNARHYMNRGVTVPNNNFSHSRVMSHSLWIMSSKGLIADSVPLFTLSVSHLQLRRCVQPVGFQPGSILSKDTAINHSLTSLRWEVGGTPCAMPTLPILAHQEKVSPNPQHSAGSGDQHWSLLFPLSWQVSFLLFYYPSICN